MEYQVILVEDNPDMLDNMIATLKNSTDFNLAATFKSVNDASGQSSIFRPNLFLINVDSIDALNNIPVFVDIFPDAKILGLVSNWDADIAMNVIAAGALGCIVKPFTAQDILDAIDLYERRGKPGLSRIISFFSPKGRAGRTTVAAILGLLLSEMSDERVALIDADLQFGDLPIFFDIEPKQTVVEASQDVKMLTPLNLKSYFHHIKKNLYLLASPDKPEYAELVESESLLEVVRLSCNLFRYVLIDLPAGFNPISVEMTQFADTSVFMAMINNGFEIQHMKRALEVSKTLREMNKKIYSVFSRVNPCTDEEKRKIESQLGFPVDVILPNEYKMISLANSGRIAKGLPKDSLLMKTLTGIAADVISGKR
ncbi:MAG: hypothetical protein IJS81_11445 [Selenomonadaceae bacterium]|nr:hypothetical protein [Selenomonadaceae bacterium]